MQIKSLPDCFAQCSHMAAEINQPDSVIIGADTVFTDPDRFVPVTHEIGNESIRIEFLQIEIIVDHADAVKFIAACMQIFGPCACHMTRISKVA